MKFAKLMFMALMASIAGASPACHDESTSVDAQFIPSGVYNELVWYFKYASSAYTPQAWCPKPNGNVLITQFTGATTDTQGYIARDDNRKEVIVAWRGSTSLTDFLIDFNMRLIPFVSPGVIPPPDVLVHTGFSKAYNSVADAVIGTVRQVLAQYPNYSIVSTGHSLGGALSSMGGIALKENFPNVPVRIFAFGQPRTGNVAYAKWVNDRIGIQNAYRGVNALDGVCTAIPRAWGYSHHGTEYWSYINPATATFTRQCKSSNNQLEDPTCSAQFPYTGMNPFHVVYYNIPSVTPFCM